MNHSIEIVKDSLASLTEAEIEKLYRDLKEFWEQETPTVHSQWESDYIRFHTDEITLQWMRLDAFVHGYLLALGIL